MYYLLLPNGRGILKRDNTRLKTSVLKLAFEGASEKASVTVCSSHNTVRAYLKNGEFVMDVSEVRGDIRITVKDDKMRWICDPRRTTDPTIIQSASKRITTYFAGALPQNEYDDKVEKRE
jgi:hypothetical protein